MPKIESLEWETELLRNAVRVKELEMPVKSSFYIFVLKVDLMLW